MRSVLLRTRATRGLTLAELAVVVAVLAVILAIAIPFFLHQREDAYNKRAISTLRNAISAQPEQAESHKLNNPGGKWQT